jgi:hypothetical protein
MALHTPQSTRSFTYSEYSSINNAYSNMVTESYKQSLYESVVNQILNKVQKNGLKKIKKCAAKSAKLANYATQTALKEACDGIECDSEVLESACEKVKKIIDHTISSIKPTYVSPKAHKKLDCGKMKEGKIMSVKEATDDEENQFYDEQDYVPSSDDMHSDDIGTNGYITDDKSSFEDFDFKKNDDMVKQEHGINVSNDIGDEDANGADFDAMDTRSKKLANGEDYGDKEEADTDDGYGEGPSDMSSEFDSEDDIIAQKDKENSDEADSPFKYVVTGIVLEMTDGDKKIGKDVSVELKDVADNLTDMEMVVDYVNKQIGFYFEANDYCYDFTETYGRYNTPILRAQKALTSDSIQGSEALNKYFGNDGRFGDYLYKADGTAKDEPSEVDVGAMSDVEKDVSVVKKFPTLVAKVFVLSINTKTNKLRKITPSDFRGTEIRVVE